MNIPDLQQAARQQFQQAHTLQAQVLDNPAIWEKLATIAQRMAASLQNGGKIISCGNGGSMCDAIHFSEELSGRYRNDRTPLAAIAIADPAYLSCVANDYGYAATFSRYIAGLGAADDVLLALSTSGNSPNILAALRQAAEQGIYTVLLSGSTGGEAYALADTAVLVPHVGYADRIQEVHICWLHGLVHLIELQLFTQ